MIYAFADDKLGTSAIKRALAPTPDSQDDALLRQISTNEGEEPAESGEEEEERDEEDKGADGKGEPGADLVNEDEGHC